MLGTQNWKIFRNKEKGKGQLMTTERQVMMTRKSSKVYIQQNWKNILAYIVRGLTGYCKLSKHQTTLELEINDSSRFCVEAEETPEHLLMNYDAFIQKRGRCLSVPGTPVVLISITNPGLYQGIGLDGGQPETAPDGIVQCI